MQTEICSRVSTVKKVEFSGTRRVVFTLVQLASVFLKALCTVWWGRWERLQGRGGAGVVRLPDLRLLLCSLHNSGADTRYGQDCANSLTTTYCPPFLRRTHPFVPPSPYVSAATYFPYLSPRKLYLFFSLSFHRSLHRSLTCLFHRNFCFWAILCRNAAKNVYIPLYCNQKIFDFSLFYVRCSGFTTKTKHKNIHYHNGFTFLAEL